MMFLKLVRQEGNKEIMETLDVPSGDLKHLGTDTLLLYEGCMNSDKAVPIFQSDLKKLYEMKINEKTS